MLVSSQIWALPSNFHPCPRTVSWLGSVAHLAGTTLCRFSNHGTPGPCDCLRAYQLPKIWGVPSMATPPRCSRGRLAPRAPFPWCPCPRHCPRGYWRYGPRFMRAHYAIPAPLGPLAYHGRLVRCPGCPLSDTHRSQPRSQPVNRTPAPLQTGFEPTLAPTAKRLPFC